MQVTLRGIGVSPGISIGPAVPFRSEEVIPPKYRVSDIEGELDRYDAAVERVNETLSALYEQTSDELGEPYAAILQTHLAILDDADLRPKVAERLKQELVNVEFIVYDHFMGFVNKMRGVDDALYRERALDFRDVCRRILSELLDHNLGTLEHLDKPSVVMAHDLTPSDTANMDVSNTLGLGTEGGGPTSHTAILARQFEIPAVVGLRLAGANVAPNDEIIVDGTSGRVIVRPDAATREFYLAEKHRQDNQRRALLEGASKGPCRTLDGHGVTLMANLEFPTEAGLKSQSSFEGIGLFRTEYLFMHRGATVPTEEEQFNAYSLVLKKISPYPVTIRTLDVGGDKLVPHLTESGETNPQLGWRSIRFCLDRPDIFKAQLRALLRASVHGTLQLLFPMISGIDVLLEAKQVLREVYQDLELRGVPFSPDVKLGCMIEVPAAVVVADKLAKECDFFSIGTNDLIQYCLAVDRVNHHIAHLYEPSHPAVIAMIKQTFDAATKAGIPCSICGEMAGDPVFTELLIGLGFDSLSMAAASLPKVRAEIANCHLSTAKQFARKVRRGRSASENRSLLLQRHESRGTMKLYPVDSNEKS